MEVKRSHFQKVQMLNFQTPPFEKRTDPRFEKNLFFGAHFSCERDRQSTFKFNKDLKVLFIYRLISRKLTFFGWLATFGITPASRFWGAFRSVHGRIQHKSACFWVSVDRYALHRAA
jgi:hypothetical protein